MVSDARLEHVMSSENGKSACAVCGSSRSLAVYVHCRDLLHHLPGSWDVIQCSDCGLARTEPPPPPESMSRYYPDRYFSAIAESGLVNLPRRFLRDALRLPYRARYGRVGALEAPPYMGARLLDIGCGTGVFLGEMRARGWDVWGVEPSGNAAANAVDFLGIPAERIVVGSAEASDFPPSSFDAITMLHVLEHLHDPRAVLVRARTWLKPGGTIRLRVPNFASAERRLFRRFWFGLDVPRHLYHFTPASLSRLLRDCGFVVERIVPEFEAISLAGSISHLFAHIRRGPTHYPLSRARYHAALPVAALLAGFGRTASLQVTARGDLR